MKTIIKNYEVKKFASFSEKIKILGQNYSPIDITNWNIYGKVKKFYDSGEYVFFGCQILNATNGLFNITLNNVVTSQLSTGNYVYDIVAQIPDEQVVRIQQGTINVSNGVLNVISIDLPPIDNGTVDEFLDGGDII